MILKQNCLGVGGGGLIERGGLIIFCFQKRGGGGLLEGRLKREGGLIEKLR